MPLGYVYTSTAKLFLPYEIRKARSSRRSAGTERRGRKRERERERESDKESGRRKRSNEGRGGIEGVVGQWSVNRRHGVMTRLSFQRLHRGKSSEFSPSPPSRIVLTPPVLPPGTPIPLLPSGGCKRDRSVSPAGIDTMGLQESGGFYVKILQKIMARYTFLATRDSVSYARRRASFPPPLPLLSGRPPQPSVSASRPLPPRPFTSGVSAFGFLRRITMHRGCISLIASLDRGRKLPGEIVHSALAQARLRSWSFARERNFRGNTEMRAVPI